MVTSSMSGIYPNRFLGVYAMGKAAIVNMVKWLAVELRDDNIRVNAVAPGITRTRMVKNEMDAGMD